MHQEQDHHLHLLPWNLREPELDCHLVCIWQVGGQPQIWHFDCLMERLEGHPNLPPCHHHQLPWHHLDPQLLLSLHGTWAALVRSQRYDTCGRIFWKWVLFAPSRRQDLPQHHLHKTRLSEVRGPSSTALTALILVGGQPQLLVALVVADWQAALLQVSGEGLLLAALFLAG